MYVSILKCIYYYNSILYYIAVMKSTMVCKFLFARNGLKTMKYIQHQLCKKKKNSWGQEFLSLLFIGVFSVSRTVPSAL